MKVLIKQGGAAPADLLSFNGLGFGFITLDGEVYAKEGTDGKEHGVAEVAEVPDGEVRRAIAAGAKKQKYASAAEIEKDMKWIARAAGDYENGTEANFKAKGRSFTIVFDESGRIDRAEGLAEGDVVAVGPTISPKSLLNAHGLVVSVNGTKCKVELDEGDLDRINRASTGRKFANPVNLPKSVVEKVA